ncbi:hypothetical protein B0O99DRAFT_375318 [Bisporella sp. PMI_857]|nr:hypothetical protein B0O99DRAFT_375318 [Bisporella sp. PMI_857]
MAVGADEPQTTGTIGSSALGNSTVAKLEEPTGTSTTDDDSVMNTQVMPKTPVDDISTGNLPTGDKTIGGQPTDTQTAASKPTGNTSKGNQPSLDDLRGAIPAGLDPLPHVMPHSGKPQTPEKIDSIKDTAGSSQTAKATSPLASPAIKRHWWRV